MADDDLDPITGLSKELGIEEDLTRTEQRVSIRTDTRRYGKAVTIIEGLDPSAVDLTELASTLKRELAVGGSVTDDRIELQGDHTDRLPAILESHGFVVDT